MNRPNSAIAEWRIDSERERELGELADRDAGRRADYVLYYKEADPGYHAKGLEMAERVISDFGVNVSGGEKENLIIDMIYSLHRFGCMYDEYFLFGYPLLNAKGRSGFITDKSRWGYYRELNGEVNLPLFNDKYMTYAKY